MRSNRGFDKRCAKLPSDDLILKFLYERRYWELKNDVFFFLQLHFEKEGFKGAEGVKRTQQAIEDLKVLRKTWRVGKPLPKRFATHPPDLRELNTPLKHPGKTYTKPPEDKTGKPLPRDHHVQFDAEGKIIWKFRGPRRPLRNAIWEFANLDLKEIPPKGSDAYDLCKNFVVRDQSDKNYSAETRDFHISRFFEYQAKAREFCEKAGITGIPVIE